MLLFVAEQVKKLQGERDAWNFFKTSLKQPLADAVSLPSALKGQNTAYSALAREQKAYLSRALVPLLLARKDKLTANGGKIDGLGTFDVDSWLRVMCTLANFDVARHTHPMNCCISAHPIVDSRNGRPRFTQ